MFTVISFTSCSCGMSCYCPETCWGWKTNLLLLHIVCQCVCVCGITHSKYQSQDNSQILRVLQKHDYIKIISKSNQHNVNAICAYWLFAHWIVFSFLQNINFINSSIAFSFHLILCRMSPKTVVSCLLTSLTLFFAALQVLLFPFGNANEVIFSDVSHCRSKVWGRWDLF